LKLLWLAINRWPCWPRTCCLLSPKPLHLSWGLKLCITFFVFILVLIFLVLIVVPRLISTITTSSLPLQELLLLLVLLLLGLQHSLELQHRWLLLLQPSIRPLHRTQPCSTKAPTTQPAKRFTRPLTYLPCSPATT
jgi:hypothetical protein